MSWSRMMSLKSQIVLKTSPIASGVVVCCRTSRRASWFSAGVQSSSQNRSYGSRDLPSLAACSGVIRWWPSCRSGSSGPNSLRTASNTVGTCRRYARVSQSSIAGNAPRCAGSKSYRTPLLPSVVLFDAMP